MSVVVAVVDFKTGDRCIGADMGVGEEHLQIVTLYPKIAKYDKILIGFVGDVFTIQKVNRILAESPRDPMIELNDLPASTWKQISALVISGFSIIEYSDSGVIAISENDAKGCIIGALGVAASIAYGAAYASRQSGHIPTTNVRLALEASSQYCPGITKQHRILSDGGKDRWIGSSHGIHTN